MGKDGTVIAAFVALAGTLATVLWTAWRFLLEQRQANRRPFLEKQLELCFQATEAAARLASEVDVAEWEKARLVFWRLYWGALCIVEDRKVARAMVELGNLVPREPVSSPALPMRTLEQLSLRLAHTMRDLILGSWQIHLAPLDEDRKQGG